MGHWEQRFVYFVYKQTSLVHHFVNVSTTNLGFLLAGVRDGAPEIQNSAFTLNLFLRSFDLA